MAELCLLAPVMILMWIGIDYFRSGYARRLDALAQSHKAAWKLAYSNDMSCFSGRSPLSGFTAGNPDLDPSAAGADAQNATNTFSSNSSSSMFFYAHANVPATVATKDARWGGGSPGQLHGATFIACNEVVPDDDQNVITPLWDFVRSLF
ncbi:MAG TPA: hypothetical protein VFF06_27060 [Polyangia bacterium]|nr:hypothetical protein [Polyangia bacterium]